MIEKISALRNKAIERTNYYTKIDFLNLANEFTELVNILNEMEAIVRERDALKEEINNYYEAAKSAREENEEDCD